MISTLSSDVLLYFGDNTNEYHDVMNRGFLRLPTGQDICIDNIWFMEQIHSDVVVEIEDISSDTKNCRVATGCDGLIARAKSGYFLAVRTADCYPVLVYDTTTQMIAVAHCGRGGTRLGLLDKILDRLISNFNSHPANINISIGPGISAKHYEVSEDIAQDFRSSFHDETINRHLNLKQLLINTAINKGIFSKNINQSNICTHEDESYFSYRRDSTFSRNLNIIGFW
jgi:hypothetical protein